MKDARGTVRYLGHRSLPDGARGFDFSFDLAGNIGKLVTVEAPMSLFTGPDRLPIQEGAGICYETVRSRLEDTPPQLPRNFTLTPVDVTEHRKVQKPRGRRR